MKEILQMYPKALHVQDMKNGGTPLHWAKSKDIVVALIEAGCMIGLISNDIHFNLIIFSTLMLIMTSMIIKNWSLSSLKKDVNSLTSYCNKHINEKSCFVTAVI